MQALGLLVETEGRRYAHRAAAVLRLVLNVLRSYEEAAPADEEHEQDQERAAQPDGAAGQKDGRDDASDAQQELAVARGWQQAYAALVLVEKICQQVSAAAYRCITRLMSPPGKLATLASCLAVARLQCPCSTLLCTLFTLRSRPPAPCARLEHCTPNARGPMGTHRVRACRCRQRLGGRPARTSRRCGWPSGACCWTAMHGSAVLQGACWEQPSQTPRSVCATTAAASELGSSEAQCGSGVRFKGWHKRGGFRSGAGKDLEMRCGSC